MPLSNLSAPPPEAIRTLALVGPAGTKTTLAEALLAAAGAIQTPGSIERGSTVADHDPLARKHQHSLNSALLHLAHRDTRIHLADTPGLPDFIGPALTALEAVETAVVVTVLAEPAAYGGFVAQERFRLPRILANRFGRWYVLGTDKSVSGRVVVEGKAALQRRAGGR